MVHRAGAPGALLGRCWGAAGALLGRCRAAAGAAGGCGGCRGLAGGCRGCEVAAPRVTRAPLIVMRPPHQLPPPAPQGLPIDEASAAKMKATGDELVEEKALALECLAE